MMAFTGKSVKRFNAGTMMKPPPTPRSPDRKPARYLYFCAYFIFILAFCSQYPFTMVWNMYKKETYVDLQKNMVESYLPTAKLFGINSLDIKLLQEDMLGAFVLPRGDHAQVVITSGLKKLLTDKELCFVMAHEFTHYKENHHQVRLHYPAKVQQPWEELRSPCCFQFHNQEPTELQYIE